MTLRERIKEARENHGLSRNELADLLKVSSKTIKEWESGETKIADDKVIDLLRALNISLDEYVSLRDKETKVEVRKEESSSSFADPIAFDEEILLETRPLIDQSKSLRKLINRVAFVAIFLSLVLIVLGFVIFGLSIIILPFILGGLLLSSVALYLIYGKFSTIDFEIVYFVTSKRVIRETRFKAGDVKRYEALYEDISDLNLKDNNTIRFTYRADSTSHHGQYFYSIDEVSEASQIYEIIKSHLKS